MNHKEQAKHMPNNVKKYKNGTMIKTCNRCDNKQCKLRRRHPWMIGLCVIRYLHFTGWYRSRGKPRGRGGLSGTGARAGTGAWAGRGAWAAMGLRDEVSWNSNVITAPSSAPPAFPENRGSGFLIHLRFCSTVLMF